MVLQNFWITLLFCFVFLQRPTKNNNTLKRKKSLELFWGSHFLPCFSGHFERLTQILSDLLRMSTFAQLFMAEKNKNEKTFEINLNFYLFTVCFAVKVECDGKHFYVISTEKVKCKRKPYLSDLKTNTQFKISIVLVSKKSNLASFILISAPKAPLSPPEVFLSLFRAKAKGRHLSL